ncbi:hypothetical protein [Vibrio tasmaniensis]|nr:hypothetical protein [Vibrio tasmaniensis]
MASVLANLIVEFKFGADEDNPTKYLTDKAIGCNSFMVSKTKQVEQ